MRVFVTARGALRCKGVAQGMFAMMTLCGNVAPMLVPLLLPSSSLGHPRAAPAHSPRYPRTRSRLISHGAAQAGR